MAKKPTVVQVPGQPQATEPEVKPQQEATETEPDADAPTSDAETPQATEPDAREVGIDWSKKTAAEAHAAGLTKSVLCIDGYYVP